MFLLVSVRHVGAHPGGNQHGVSIQISIYLGKTFLRISRIRKILRFWPESWRGSLYIYLLSFPRYWTLSINPRAYTQIHTPTYKEGGAVEPLPGVFDMLQYFVTILPFDLLNEMRYILGVVALL